MSSRATSRSTASRAGVLALGAAVTVGLAACGGSSSSESAGATKATGSVDGKGREIVYFALEGKIPYLKNLIVSAKAEAKRLNYKLKVVETPFDQSAQNDQAQQYIASGQKPAAFLLAPFSPAASVNATRALSRVAPVVQFTGYPESEKDRAYIKAYAGVSDYKLGQAVGKMALQARDDAKKAGRKLNSSGGNLVYFGVPTGVAAGVQRLAGFKDATKAAPFNLIGQESSTTDPAETFNVASQALPKYKSKGIDFVFAFNTTSATGVVKALKQQGYKPGEDVDVVSGNCGAGLGEIKSGEVYGLALQSSEIEGQIGIRTVARLLATGKTVPGETVAPLSPDAPPAVPDTPPSEDEFLPMTTATSKTLASTKLWGLTTDQICPG